MRVFQPQPVQMLEAEFLQVEAVSEGANEPDWVFFIHIFFERFWEEGFLVSVEVFYMFAHGSSVALKLV